MLILIAGITGSLGQQLATVALSRGLSVRGLGRSPQNLPANLLAKLESFIQSTSYYDISALDQAMKGVDAVINAYAPDPVLDLDGGLLLLRAAERATIKIFIASSWSRDWTNIKFGDFEHYNNHIAFEHQAATTSSIRPVYIFSGLFADLLYTPYGPGGFHEGKMRYWGDGDEDKYPWTTQEDAAEWTVDLLLHSPAVIAGEGGKFKFSGGVTTICELAAVREEFFGGEVEVERVGSMEDLESKLEGMRREGGRERYVEWMPEAAAVLAGKGLWENRDAVMLKEFREATTLKKYLRVVREKTETELENKA